MIRSRELGPSWVGLIHGVGGTVSSLSSRFVRRIFVLPSPLRHHQIAAVLMAFVCIGAILSQVLFRGRRFCDAASAHDYKKVDLYAGFLVYTVLFSMLAPQLLVAAYTVLLGELKTPTLLGVEDALASLARASAPLVVSLIGSPSLSYGVSGVGCFLLVALGGI